MNELQAQEDIQFIKEMIEKTKKITAGSWMFFLVWGIVAVLGVAGMYTLVIFEKYPWIWLNWIVFVAIGVVYTIVHSHRLEKSQGTKTYTQRTLWHFSFACGIAFILVGFVFPALGLYSYGVIPVLISTVAGILVFGVGGIFEWSLLKWCGVVWWAGTVGMIFINENYRGLLFVPLILIGYIMPALVLRSMYRKQREGDAC